MSGCGCWTIGKGGCTRVLGLRIGGPTIRFFWRSARPSGTVVFPCSCSRICSARFVRISRRIDIPTWDLGARLLPAIGESGGPAGAAHCGLRRSAARSVVGCAVHGAAVDQLLAGFRTRLAERSSLCAARGRRGVPCTSPGSVQFANDRAVESRASARRRAHARVVPRRPRRVRRRARPASIRAAADVARRHAHSRAPRGCALRCLRVSSDADTRATRRGSFGRRSPGTVHERPGDDLLLLLPGTAQGKAAGDYRRVGFLPRCG